MITDTSLDRNENLVVNNISFSGFARYNGVNFIGDKYKVSFTINKDQSVSIKSKKYKSAGKITIYLRRFPILRTFAWFIETPVLFLLFIFMISVDITIRAERESSFLSENYQRPVMIIIVLLLIASLAFIIRSIWEAKKIRKFHGAEHKTIYAAENNINLELDNVRKCPRVSERCGTNFAVFFVCITVILFIARIYLNVLDFISVIFIISFLLANELFKIKDGESKPILKYFYSIGFWVQQNLGTTEPTDAQLLASISAMNELIELENNG